jgi:ankyrin repeat protein
MFRDIAVAIAIVLAPVGASPVAADDLSVAVKARNEEQVLALLRAGADPNRHASYETPIGLAAALGPPEIVVSLLDAGADPRVRGFGGASPLHTAVLSGQSEIARILIQRGADVDALDNLGRTPLLTYASGSAHNLEVLHVLLKAGANPNAADPVSEISVLDYVALQGHVDEAEALVAAGAKVNGRDSYFKTPLHFALDCCNGSIGNHDMVQSLISSGADVNAKDINGRTPLDYVRTCTPNGGFMIYILTKAGAY